MWGEILVALSALIGSAIAGFGGFRLIAYRIDKLEQKVDEHNQVIRRTFVLEEKQKVTDHRLDDLERHEEQRRK